MANHKSAIKRAGQNEIRRLRNKAVKTRVKNIVKELRGAAATDGDCVAKLHEAQSTIDRAAKKGVIHKNTAARKISRLSKLINTASA